VIVKELNEENLMKHMNDPQLDYLLNEKKKKVVIEEKITEKVV